MEVFSPYIIVFTLISVNLVMAVSRWFIDSWDGKKYRVEETASICVALLLASTLSSSIIISVVDVTLVLMNALLLYRDVWYQHTGLLRKHEIEHIGDRQMHVYSKNGTLSTVITSEESTLTISKAFTKSDNPLYAPNFGDTTWAYTKSGFFEHVCWTYKMWRKFEDWLNKKEFRNVLPRCNVKANAL